MFLLSSDEKKFINCNNIGSIYIEKFYINSKHFESHEQWEIRVMYSALSEEIIYDTLATFYTEQECNNTFKRLCHLIANGRENDVIDMGDLWD